MSDAVDSPRSVASNASTPVASAASAAGTPRSGTPHTAASAAAAAALVAQAEAVAAHMQQQQHQQALALQHAAALQQHHQQQQQQQQQQQVAAAAAAALGYGAGGRLGAKPDQTKYQQLLAVIEELGKDIRPTYSGSKNSADRLKRGIMHARILVRECLVEAQQANRA